MVRTLLLAAFVVSLAVPRIVSADDRSRHGPCEEEVERKTNEYKREVKCKDGVGAFWDSPFKEEFRDGDCLVKREADREVFKEEVVCEGRIDDWDEDDDLP